MKNIYYLIWVDSILSFNKFHPKKADWKVRLFLFNTWMHALNWWIVFMIIKFFNFWTIPLVKINLFPGHLLNDFFAFTIEFALPFGILNYFLIFYKDKYKILIEKYGQQKTRYALIYSMSISLGAFVTAILYGLFKS